MSNKVIDRKRSIGLASKEVGLDDHVLRFWEKEFPQIKPDIGKGARRYYFDKDIENIKRYLKIVIRDAEKLGIDLKNAMIVYEEENDAIVYDSMESFLNGEIAKLRNMGGHRILHVLSPFEKQKELRRNHELMKERKEYLAGGDDAFRKKHGGMDPLEYHLLAYEE